MITEKFEAHSTLWASTQDVHIKLETKFPVTPEEISSDDLDKTIDEYAEYLKQYINNAFSYRDWKEHNK